MNCNFRILALPRYGRTGANSRYRIWQYLPLFQAAGCRIEVQPLLADTYLQKLYESARRNPVSVLFAYLRRISQLWRVLRADIVLLDQELFPYLPAWFEWAAAKLGVRIIADFDDAAYCKYLSNPLLRGKISGILRASSCVVVGNRHLAEYAQGFAQRVEQIPTVVDIQKYTPRAGNSPGDTVTLCWIGTPITAARFLAEKVPVLKELQQRFLGLHFRFIGCSSIQGAEALEAEFLPWSEASEAGLIAACDIGIMPLRDEEFERGKCGLKLIQYMAAGLPVVASPVGENRFIVDHGVNGFLAAGDEDWIEHLSTLILDPEKRVSFGRAARRKVEERYSLQYGFARWMGIFGAIQSEDSSSRASKFSKTIF